MASSIKNNVLTIEETFSQPQATRQILGEIHQFISPLHKKIRRLVFVSLTARIKFNFVLFTVKQHLFSQDLEKGKLRYLRNQTFMN